MQGDSLSNLSCAVMESHPPIIHGSDGGNDMFNLECVTQHPMTHTAAGAEGHLGILDVESSRRKQIDRTSVVEMHVSQNDITNERGIDPYPVEYVSNRGQDHASRTPRRSGSVHPSIDDDYAWR